MRRSGVWAAVTCAVLICVGGAFAARAASPPPGTFSGSYKVTYLVTNTKSKPWHWIYAAHPSCASRCHVVSFRQRLVSEKAWEKGLATFRWNGKDYGQRFTRRNYADCYPKSGGTVKLGYDLVATRAFLTKTVKNGRVVKFSGTAQDKYVLNAKGRAHHCKWGAYDYVFTGVAQ